MTAISPAPQQYSASPNRAVRAANGVDYAYRDVGEGTPPLVLLQHFRGNLDNWDPALIDALASGRRVVTFDNVGVGGSTGLTPNTMTQMAIDAIAFLDAMEFETVDLLGFSIGSFVAQEISLIRPAVVRRLILASSAPQGAAGMHGWAPDVIGAVGRPTPNPDGYLGVFFTHSAESQQAGAETLARLTAREGDRDKPTTWQTRQAQYDAVCAWGIPDHGLLQRASGIEMPVFVTNGDSDPMILPRYTHLLAGLLPQAKVKIYHPDSAHGFLFQHHQRFAADSKCLSCGTAVRSAASSGQSGVPFHMARVTGASQGVTGATHGDELQACAVINQRSVKTRERSSLMGIKRTIPAIVAALIASAVSAAAPMAASAGTPACGPGCIGVFSSELGSYAQPNFIEHVWGGTASVGTPTGLTQASGSDSSEDFINPHPGKVSDYFNLGLVSADVNSHYGNLKASQLEYAPLGVPTGLCVAAADDPYQNEALSLQSCTIPGRTVWIIGTSLSPATAAKGFFPIVSGATSDFSHPFTMSYPRHVDTSDTLPPIRLRHLEFLGADKTVPAQQLWGVKLGALQ